MVAGMSSIAAGDWDWRTALSGIGRQGRLWGGCGCCGRRGIYWRRCDGCSVWMRCSGELALNAGGYVWWRRYLPLLAACARFWSMRLRRILEDATARAEKDFPSGWLGFRVRSWSGWRWGRVLVIGPANYPLFLPGCAGASGVGSGECGGLEAGCGCGRQCCAWCLRLRRCSEAGLPEGLLRVTDESVDAAVCEMKAGVGKVFFTGLPRLEAR